MLQEQQLRQHVEEVLRKWNDGRTIRAERDNAVWSLVGASDTEQLIALLPSDLLDVLYERAERLPHNADDWEQLRYFHIGEGAESITINHAELAMEDRERAEKLRAWFAANPEKEAGCKRRIQERNEALQREREVWEYWRGRERACPKCATRFTSCGDRGQCKGCGYVFLASETLKS